MRKEIACVILILLAACVNKPGQPVQEATSTAVIGGADSMTSIVVADTCASFQDTVTYELRQCQLWYTKDLPEAYNGETRLWTEYEVYTENVPVINVFVSNPTDIPLEFGRDMRFYLWKNDKWCPPEQRDTSYTIVWNSDAFMIKKAPLLYCFRYKLNEYCIPKGNTVFRNHLVEVMNTFFWQTVLRLNKKCVEYEKLVYLFRGDDGNMRAGMQSHGIKKTGYADWTCRCTMPEL